MVAVIQTFSDDLKWNPHLHCIVTRGAFNGHRQWLPLPYIDTHAAEILPRSALLTPPVPHQNASACEIIDLRAVLSSED
jgi:hypothetical protein